MSGPGAPGDTAAAPVMQTWLAVGNEPTARGTGRYFYHRREKAPALATQREDLQDALIEPCAQLSGQFACSCLPMAFV
jgi:hypothetical protein